ncbi:hypothetical protein IEO21_03561 [Rhodonia placenta]|uniref:Nucleoside diphosphate kinase n=1 Tax=Rhodonia placenta TaxID=104341 RepID=A0A8H7U3F0_9APHY|nr:hypothetical protein IEO21_03561 [Postia placenta]
MSDSLDFALSPEHSPARSPLASPPHDDVPLSEPLTESETHFETPQEVEAPSTPVPPSRSTSYSLPPTRTVAIIKAHAMDHRFDIEQRISEAGFEIVKERQMEFDIETDPDTMFELFGDEFESFAEGPVWVYVLERRRAVEVWTTLMGDVDPVVARKYTPNSIRALYGISAMQNAVMGSPDGPTAEIQISAIFASSPPFPTTELPDVGDSFPAGSLRSVSSSVLSALRKTTSSGSGNGSSVTSPSRAGDKTPNGKALFKARPVPATIATPTIVPRMSRASALRAGLPVEKAERAPPTKERLAKTFANVPGHKRSETITVASTAPPVVAPRMTRAASLRMGQKSAESPRKSIVPAANGKPNGTVASANDTAAKRATFDGVPGHKRRESIPVSSTKPPTVPPRTNRSASLRQMKEAAPPSSFSFKNPSTQAPSRSSSRTSNNAPSGRVPLSRPASAASTQPATSRPPVSRRSSSVSRPSTSAGIVSATASAGDPAATADSAKPKPKPRPSVQAPTIAPRTNKSALLRAAKMATTAAAAPPVKAKAATATTSRAVRV